MSSLSTFSFPPPSGESLSLVSALSNPENHEIHVAAIQARDNALSNEISYTNLCIQLAIIMIGSDKPNEYIISRISNHELEYWKNTDMQSVSRLQQDSSLWIPFGQMAGFILKNALLHPPIILLSNSNNNKPLCITQSASETLKEILIYALHCDHNELRAVASTIIATISVSIDSIQPYLHIKSWPTLMSQLLHIITTSTENSNAVDGALQTLSKMMEDGPSEIPMIDLDHAVPIWIQVLNNNNNNNNSHHKVAAMQCIISCISNHNNIFPSALVAHWNEYLHALSNLANDTTTVIKSHVCKSLVAILYSKTEYLAPHLASVCPFLLSATTTQNNNNNEDETVALEACEFWLTFASLDDHVLSGDMHDVVGQLLPQLIPILLNNMIYSVEKQNELMINNNNENDNNMKPIFHKSRAASTTTHQQQQNHGAMDDTERVNNVRNSHIDGDTDDDDDDTGYDEDDEGFDNNNNNDFDDDDNEWTLRKCSAASLDSLATLYGGDIILPILLPCIEQGLTCNDPWKQEACILALGAIAEGCQDEMKQYMNQIHPLLMQLLSVDNTNNNIPSQLLCIAAWTAGQYSTWVVEQVQTGIQGHLLGQMIEILLQRMLHNTNNSKVQIACIASFGAIVEAAGDLLVPYLHHIYQIFYITLQNFTGRALLTVFDILGILAEHCGAPIGENNLLHIYIPQLLHIWNGLMKHDVRDRTLLPLMESLASIAITSGINFQPYALECFENSMSIIESITLLLTTTTTTGNDIINEEEVDPIICATDLIDGIVEGIGTNFISLLSSSTRYGPQFLNVLLSMCQHDIAGVRMSALALVGDLARNAPSILEPALTQLIQEAINNMDPIQPTVATNAVWAIGEICIKCRGNSTILEPYAPMLVQNLISILMGNTNIDGYGRGSTIPGLCENAAACTGRLAMVNPNFVANDLSRFLLGWCDGMSKINDITERKDAFNGFIQCIYANPQSIQNASTDISNTITSILFAIITWHIPNNIFSENSNNNLLSGNVYNFIPFPPSENELHIALIKLIQDIKISVGNDIWHIVEKSLPVNVRRLMRESYQL